MEPLTQGLLGAVVARVAAPSLGRRALLWGALVGMAPDLDVLLSPLDRGFGELVYHRGTTHSLWFGFVLGPLAEVAPELRHPVSGKTMAALWQGFDQEAHPMRKVEIALN